MHSPPRNGEGFWTPGTVGRQDVASPQPSGEGDHPFPHPIPLPATGSSLLAGRPPCPAPQAGQQTGGHPHGAGALERRKTVHVLEAGGGWRITSGRGRAEGHPPSPTGLGSSKAPADASSGHQGAPRPLPPLPPPLPPGPGARGLRALPARAVPLWWALQVRTGPPAHTHPAARNSSSRSCRRVEKPERVLTQNGSQAGRATPLTAARSGQESQAGHFRPPGLVVGADTMEGKLPGHSQLFLSSGLRRSWGEV